MPQAVRQKEIVLQASAAQTASSNTAAVNLLADWAALPDPFEASPVWLRAQLDVTAVSGTAPTLDVVIEDSVDGTNWNAIATFSQKTGVAREVVSAAPRGDAQPAGFAWPFNAARVRVRWTIGGTVPSFTLSVKSVVGQ